MVIYSIHMQRFYSECSCLSNIGYLQKCSVAWSILIQVALQIQGFIHSLMAHSWSRNSKTIFREKSRNNTTIVWVEWWLNIRVDKRGLIQPPAIAVWFKKRWNLLKWQWRNLLSWDSWSLRLHSSSSLLSNTTQNKFNNVPVQYCSGHEWKTHLSFSFTSLSWIIQAFPTEKD